MRVSSTMEELSVRVGALFSEADRRLFDAAGYAVPTPSDMAQDLAALSHQVAPAYLPILSSASTVVALHVRPGRHPMDCPVVAIERDEQQARWMCPHLSELPRALLPAAMVWAANSARQLELVELVCRCLAMRGRPLVTEAAQEVAMRIEAVRWDPGQPSLDLEWSRIGISHPFSGFPWPFRSRNAASEMRLFSERHDGEIPVELDAMILAELAPSDGLDRRRTWRLLTSENWREATFEPYSFSRGAPEGEGVELWDIVAQLLPKHPSSVEGTSAEVLISAPRAYSGRDVDAIDTLERFGCDLKRQGHLDEALSVLRNALHVRVFASSSSGEREARGRLRELCEAMEPDGLSAKLVSCTEVSLESGP